MPKKSPMTLRIVSTLFIIYGLLEIADLFMPVETENTIQYSVPSLGIFLLLFGIGMLFSRDWARKGSALSCVYGVYLSLLGMSYSSGPALFLNLILAGLFGTAFWYLTRPSIQACFGKAPHVRNHSQCPNCQAVYSAPLEQLGKEGVCGNCGVEFVIAEPEHKSTNPRTDLGDVDRPGDLLGVCFQLLSAFSGVLVIAIDLVFAAWANRGRPWYVYVLNCVLLFIASSAINTSYIQGLTRGFSYLYVLKLRGVPKAIGVNLLTFLFFAVAYWVTSFVFSSSKQTILFFAACIALSTVVVVVDGRFAQAIERTRMLERIGSWQLESEP